ncbi:hypothetical protein [Rhizohabitans arisaemae]|uniref:hypothetical protein n=1 Tax=Rhizohabitans arisaemae TaxID=2720610 RepID=UPI0024B24226|nr:hypothetical protein [Rhizohabitans arisaemae]
MPDDSQSTAKFGRFGFKESPFADVDRGEDTQTFTPDFDDPLQTGPDTLSWPPEGGRRIPAWEGADDSRRRKSPNPSAGRPRERRRRTAEGRRPGRRGGLVAALAAAAVVALTAVTVVIVNSGAESEACPDGSVCAAAPRQPSEAPPLTLDDPGESPTDEDEPATEPAEKSPEPERTTTPDPAPQPPSRRPSPAPSPTKSGKPTPTTRPAPPPVPEVTDPSPDVTDDGSEPEPEPTLDPAPGPSRPTLTGPPSTAPELRAATDLTLSYELVETARARYTARLVVSNDTGGELNTWTVSLPVGGTVQSAEGAEWTQREENLVLTGTVLGPGETAVVVFGARGRPHEPTACTYEGGSCRLAP